MGGLILALTSALAYGTSDFMGGLASRRTDVLRVLVVSYPVSAVLMLLAAIPAGGSPTLVDLLWGAAAGLVMAFAAWSFYLALAVGPISIVSPITALLSAAVPLTIGLALGERIEPVAMGGVVAALLAVVLVSLSPHADTHASHPFTRYVAILTFASGIAWAGSYVFTGQIDEAAGIWPLLAARAAASVAVLAVAASRSHLAPPRGRALVQSVVIGVLDAIAHLTMMLALQSGLLSLSSVVISLFPAITVLLAVTVLREKLSMIQLAGLALGAVGVVLIGL